MVEGTQIGAYRVLRQIGEGGMGSVWLAEHLALGRRAALKVLHPEFSARPDIITRFFNEARAAAMIADPGIVQIFDFGHHVDGRAYIVMEMLEGEPLDLRLKREGVLAVPDGLRLMRQVASTLGAAHARGIVHRDLKPENVYIVRDAEVPGGERAKVLDFGIAKLIGDHAGIKTQTTAVMGTPSYMSPEQCRGVGQVDQRSDVYALGCMLFTLLTGRPPFDADGIGDIIAMQLREAPPAPSQLRPGTPPEIDQLVLRCLAKDPAQRFPTAGELAIAIGALLGSSPQVSSAPAIRYSLATVPTTLSGASGAGSAPPAQRLRMGRLAAVAGIGAAGVAIALIAAARNVRPSAPATAPLSAPAPVSVAMADGPPAATPPAPTPPAPLPPLRDPKVEAARVLKEALTRFAAWSRDHSGAPCPDAAVLDVPDDPWGHRPVITCTEQPPDQIIGAISAGPDGERGTTDDIASWKLERDVTEIVRGARWLVAPRPQQATKAAVPATLRPSGRATKPPKPETIKLDENGMPIAR
jgi:hypothetical protein